MEAPRSEICLIANARYSTDKKDEATLSRVSTKSPRNQNHGLTLLLLGNSDSEEPSKLGKHQELHFSLSRTCCLVSKGSISKTRTSNCNKRAKQNHNGNQTRRWLRGVLIHFRTCTPPVLPTCMFEAPTSLGAPSISTLCTKPLQGDWELQLP